MKKSISLIIVAVILFILASTPWLSGYYFKQQYLAIIAHNNQSSDMQITVLEYQNGWFKSHVTLQINNPSAKLLAHLTEVTLVQEIAHGPLVYDRVKRAYRFAAANINNTLYLAPDLEQILFGSPIKRPAAYVNTNISYNGEWLNQVTFPAYLINHAGVGKLTWNGAIGSMTFNVVNDSITNLRSDFHIGAINIDITLPTHTTDIQASILDSNLSYNMALQPIGLWTGESQFTIPRITIKNPLGNLIDLQDYSIRQSSNIDGDQYNANVQMTFNDLNMPMYAIPDISAAKINIAAQNFSAANLLTYSQFLKNTNLTIGAAQIRQQVLQHLLAILTPNSIMTANVDMSTSLGGLNVNANAYWPKDTALPRTNDAFINNVGIQIHIKIAKELAKKIALSAGFAPTPPPVTPPVPVVVTTPVAANPPPQVNTLSSTALFNEKINDMVKAGKIVPINAIQIITIGAKHYSPNEFADSLHQFSLAPDVETAIKGWYAQSQNSSVATPNKTNLPSAQNNVIVNPITTPPTPAPAPTMDTLMNTWAQQGYLIQDGDDSYTIEITHNNGAFMVNGKPFTLPK